MKTLLPTCFFCGLTIFLSQQKSMNNNADMVFGMLAILFTQNMLQTVIEDVAKEKEDKMQEVMQIYGISRNTYWTSYSIFYVGVFAPALAAIVSGLLCGLSDLFGQRSFETTFLVWVFLWLHLSTLVVLAFGVTIQSTSLEGALGLGQILQVVGLFLPALIFQHAIETLTDAPQDLAVAQAGPTTGSIILTVLFGVCLPYMPLNFFISTSSAASRLPADSPAFFAVTFKEMLTSPRQFPLFYQYLLLLGTNIGWYSLVILLDRRAHQSGRGEITSSLRLQAQPPHARLPHFGNTPPLLLPFFNITLPSLSSTLPFCVQTWLHMRSQTNVPVWAHCCSLVPVPVLPVL